MSDFRKRKGKIKEEGEKHLWLFNSSRNYFSQEGKDLQLYSGGGAGV